VVARLKKIGGAPVERSLLENMKEFESCYRSFLLGA